MTLLLLIGLGASQPLPARGQALDFTAVEAEVDFGKPLQAWDGFGFNYVETAQTRDYALDPQDYGGFSLLADADRQAILERVFGDEGLRVGLLKMFLDPFHQSQPGGPFDHATTTRQMCFFAREGLKLVFYSRFSHLPCS